MHLHVYRLFTVFILLSVILLVFIIPPQISADRYEIIPSRNLMVESGDGLELQSVQPIKNVTIQVPSLIPQKEEMSMGKGYVAAYFNTNINSPNEMVEDRQRYAASGLFNIHITHQYAG